MEEIILASASPRRRQLLQQMQLPFRVVIPDCDEQGIREPDAHRLVMTLAHEKGKSVYSLLEKFSPVWISGFDTMIEIDGMLIGKAGTENEARDMLSLLSGKVHRVITGVALYPGSGTWDIRTAVSEVHLISLSEKEREMYIATGEWKGAAGSYRIQQRGACFIDWIKGSYSNIVGLPISLFYGMLKDNNYSFSLRQDN